VSTVHVIDLKNKRGTAPLRAYPTKRTLWNSAYLQECAPQSMRWLTSRQIGQFDKHFRGSLPIDRHSDLGSIATTAVEM